MWRRKPERPPAPPYEDVRDVAEVLSRIRPELIERHFAVSADAARQFMDRLVAERHFGGLQPDGWHYPPIRKLRPRRSHRTPKTTTKSKIDERRASETASVEHLTRRIDELEQQGHVLRAKVQRLQSAGRAIIAQRGEWKARALAAEELLAFERHQHSKGDDRFNVLRHLIAKELHPDFCAGGNIEKLLRAECFKKLWPQIDRLAEQR
jgi:hypothetical protein